MTRTEYAPELADEPNEVTVKVWVGPQARVNCHVYGNGALVSIGGAEIHATYSVLSEAESLDVLAGVLARALAAVNAERAALLKGTFA